MSGGGSPSQRRAGAWACATIVLWAGGCGRSGAAPAGEPELSVAVGAAAACRALASSEAARPQNAERAAREHVLQSILSSWATPGSTTAPGSESFSLRVEVVAARSGAIAEASVELEGASFKVPVHSRALGVGSSERSLYVTAKDDPERATAFGTIGANGRISFTHCGELWSLPPSGLATRAPSATPVAALAITGAGERYFGGRTPQWWGGRLTELKRAGPAALYALAVQRARAAGLAVHERGDEVSVEPPPRGEFR